MSSDTPPPSGESSPDPYGQPPSSDPTPSSPYGQSPSDPYGQPPADPYGQPPSSDSYGQPSSSDPYGQPPSYPAAGYGQPGYGQPGYGQPGYGGPQQFGRQRNGMALASMITGIVSIPLICLCFLGGISGLVAAILGFVARGQIKASEGRQEGEGFALAGIITGIAAILLCVALIVVSVMTDENNFTFDTNM